MLNLFKFRLGKKIKNDASLDTLAKYFLFFNSEHRNSTLIAVKRLMYDFGFVNSIKSNSCIDKDSQPIPWYTYPAIEFLKQLDLTDKKVFEFGAGNSSKFWADLVKEIVSVEEKKEWYEICLKGKRNNQTILNCETEESYIGSILNYEHNFDIIIIDGDMDRFKCSQNAINKLNDGGLIILDNSDRAQEFEEYANSTKLLREKGFIQVDMSGFGPINNYTWTTSFFFHRNYNFSPKNGIQPSKSIGNIIEKF